MLGMFGNRPRRSMNEQAMTGPMPEALAAPQLQTMPMPQTQSVPAPRRGNGLRNVAGVLGDMLATAGGGRAMFIPQMMQERDEQRQLQLRQQLQAEDRAYEESQWQRRADYERANPAPRFFEDNAGNQWQLGPDGQPRLMFRDPTPRYQFVPGLNENGDTVLNRVEIPNNVPMNGTPQAGPQGSPQASGGLRPLPESQAAPMRRALGEQGFAQYLQRQGLMVVPDGANAASPQDAIIAEMRRRGLM